MTCAKRRVTAILVGASGQHYIGMNACTIPQAVCPRDPGEGYEKCKSVCRQKGHAETMALQQAGDDARGGTITIVGHEYVCEDCVEALDEAGVLRAVLSP